MSSIYDWSKVAANNATSDALINWAEGQPPSSVNNSARQLEARVVEFLGDIGGALTAGGTANAQTVTANSAFAAYANGLMMALRIATSNTSAATLNVNGLGAKSIRKMDSSGDVALIGGELLAGGIYWLEYSAAVNAAAGGWLLLNPTLDYREVPFSPSFTATGCTFSYASRTGACTKIGRQVFCSADIVLNGSGNTLNANNLSITSLPFTPSASIGSGIFPVRVVGSTTAYVSITGRVISGSALVFEGFSAAVVGPAGLPANGMLSPTAGTSVSVVFSYYI
jgi:hypothetical protein